MKIFKTLSTTALSLALTLFLLSAALPGNDSILGEWYTTDKGAKVQIYECDGGKLCGKIVWLADPNDENGKPKTDINNPEESNHKKPIIGLNVLHGFEKDDDNVWDEGKIYDPENGKTYSCKMTLEGDVLEVRGYVGVPMFGRTETWSRVK